MVAVTLLLVEAAVVQAAVTVNQTVPVSIGLRIPCTDDFVRLEGDLHFVLSSTHDGEGGLHITSLYNPQGVSGVSVRGVKYQGTGVERHDFNVKPPFPLGLMYIRDFRAIGQGPGNDVIVRMMLGYTVNANGETTADVFYYSESCGSGG